MTVIRLTLSLVPLLGWACPAAASVPAAFAKDGTTGACTQGPGDETSMMQLKTAGPELEGTKPRQTQRYPPATPLPGWFPKKHDPNPIPYGNRPRASVPVTAEKEASLLSSDSSRRFGPLPPPIQKGLIKINEDGVINEYYLPGAKTVDDSTAVEYSPPHRFYLMKKYTLNYSNAEDFYKPLLIGKTFSVDFAFGPDPALCGCNINFYLVDMPVEKPGKDNDYYCDAQCFPDMGCCVEFDMNEGNGAAQSVANHACNPPYPDHPDWECNKWGAPGVHTKDEDFGPGAMQYINSKHNFTYTQRFDVDAEGYLFITTVIIQGANVWSKQMGPNSELQSIKPFFEKGLAFVTGYWTAPDMGWLDQHSSACNYTEETPYLFCNNNTVVLSNWRITTNDSPIPTTTTTTMPPSMCCWSTSKQCDASCQAKDNWPNDWCDQSADNCESCTGTFCPHPAPPPPDDFFCCSAANCDCSAVALPDPFPVPRTDHCGLSNASCEQDCGGTWCSASQHAAPDIDDVDDDEAPEIDDQWGSWGSWR